MTKPRQNRNKVKQEPLILNTEETARLLNVTRQRIGQYVRDGMPKHAIGKFDATAVVAWKIEQTENRLQSSELETAKLAEVRARTEKHLIDVALRRSSLLRFEDTNQLLEAGAVRVMYELQAMSGRIQTDTKTRIAINDECNAVAARLAEYFAEQAKRLANSGKFIEDTPPPAKKNSGRVGRRKAHPTPRVSNSRAVE